MVLVENSNENKRNLIQKQRAIKRVIRMKKRQ